MFLSRNLEILFYLFNWNFYSIVKSNQTLCRSNLSRLLIIIIIPCPSVRLWLQLLLKGLSDYWNFQEIFLLLFNCAYDKKDLALRSPSLVQITTTTSVGGTIYTYFICIFFYKYSKIMRLFSIILVYLGQVSNVY